MRLATTAGAALATAAAAIVVVVAATLLAPATPSHAATATTITATTTTLTLNFTSVDGTTGNAQSCEGCLVQPATSVATGLTEQTAKRVKNGQVTFTLPTKTTRGLTFSIRTKGSGINRVVNGEEVDIDAVPYIVVRYQGAGVGTELSASDVTKPQSASPCWAGTNKSEANLNVVVNMIEGTGIAATKKAGEYKSVEGVKIPVAWLVPTAKNLGGMSAVNRFDKTGLYVAQDNPVCGRTA